MFQFATKIMSEADYALVHKVIPAMDTLTKYLDTTRDNVKFEPIIRVAAVRGLKILNKYYSRTDDSEVYRISMSKWLAMRT